MIAILVGLSYEKISYRKLMIKKVRDSEFGLRASVVETGSSYLGLHLTSIG